MSSAREEILARIGRALGRERMANETRAELDRRLAEPPAYPRPAVDDNLVQAFESRLTAVQGGFRTTDGVRLMEAVAACLDGHGLERSLVAAPALDGLPWPGEWTVRFGASKGEDRVAVTPCFAAVAETGSVVLLSGPGSPTSLNFLPELHIVLVYADQLVRHVEDVWTRLRAAGEAPRTVNFITGPSKTADVEQTIQYGAHGPRSLDVVFVEQQSGDVRG